MLQRSVAIAYPLGDVLTLALLARLLAPGFRGTTRCVQLLTLGTVGCLVSDVAFDWVQLHGTFHNGTIIDLGWALFYTAWGASALHPSMTTLTEPVPRQQEEVSPARLAVLMLASLIAPVVLITAVPSGIAADVSVIAVFSAILYLLVLARLWDAAASHHRALNRERVLREARPVPGDRGRPARGRRHGEGRRATPCSASTRGATRYSRCGLTASSGPRPPAAGSRHRSSNWAG